MSSDALIIEYIKKETEPIFKKYDFIEKVYLIGSHAKGKAISNSDIDIVVILNAKVGIKLYGLYDDFENTLNKKVDVMTENEIKSIMPKTYERDRMLIYEK